MAGLTDKRKRFCQEYVKDFNGTQAAIRAGYAKNSANEQAAALLAILSVQEYVAELKAELAAKDIITKEEIILAMANIVRADSRSLYDDNGNLKPVKEWDDANAGALSGFDVEELDAFDPILGKYPIGKLKKVKQADKKGAAEVLNKMLGFNAPEKRELSGPGGKPIQTEGTTTIDFTRVSTAALAELLNARNT